MSQHAAYQYSVTIHTRDLALVHCLRALSQFAQKTGNSRIPWGGTKEEDWSRDHHRVTFHFSSVQYRDDFLAQSRRLLPGDLWQEHARSDNNPAKPAK